MVSCFAVWVLAVFLQSVYCFGTPSIDVRAEWNDTMSLFPKKYVHVDEQHGSSRVRYTYSEDLVLETKNRTLYWYFKPAGAPKFHLIALEKGGFENCSLSPMFMERLMQCGSVLTLGSVNYEDVGIFKLRVKYGRANSQIILWNTEVVLLAPMIVPIKASKYNFAFKCADVSCPQCSVWVDVPAERPPSVNFVYGSYGYNLITQVDALRGGNMQVKCCSRYDELEKCTPWVNIHIDGSLCSKDVGTRQQCKVRGDGLPNEKYGEWRFWALEGHDWESYMPTFSREQRCFKSRVIMGNQSVCVGHPVRLVSNDYIWMDNMLWEGNFTWGVKEKIRSQKMWKRIGENYKCRDPIHYGSCSSDLFIRKVSWRDNTMYRSKHGRVYNFNLSVRLPLAVGLHLMQTFPSGYRLKCVYQAYGHPAKVDWLVSGAYHDYQVEGDELLLWPDCVHSLDLWRSQVHVKCVVTSDSWEGRSSGFTVHAYRNGCAWKVPWEGPGFAVLMIPEPYV